MTAFATEKRIPHPFTRVPIQSFTAPVQAPPAETRDEGPIRPPTHEEIARCAHDIYIAHGRAEGRRELDWLQAEEELAQRPRTSAAKPEAPFRY